MKYIDFISALAEKYPWSQRWWRLGEVVVGTEKRAWSVKDLNDEVPQDVQSLGCSGKAANGNWDYAFWDLDINHGTDSYVDINAAIFAAKRLCRFLDGYREIRRSKSGNGIHVRQQFKEPLPGDFPIADYCKTWVDNVELRADASPLGRQVAWLWSRPPRPWGAFEEVAHYEEDANELSNDCKK